MKRISTATGNSKAFVFNWDICGYIIIIVRLKNQTFSTFGINLGYKSHIYFHAFRPESFLSSFFSSFIVGIKGKLI